MVTQVPFENEKLVGDTKESAILHIKYLGTCVMVYLQHLQQ